MLPIPNLIYSVVFALMGAGYLFTIIRLASRGGSLMGKPSISPFLFYSGKFSMFIAWGLALAKGIVPDLLMKVPEWMSWAGAILLVLGTAVLLASFYTLGTALNYGLPDHETRLRTGGIYAFSRHPLYLGVFLITLSAAVFLPVLVNWLVLIYVVITNYLMVLGEERFLAERFGEEWEDYAGRVRRFV